MARQLHRDYGFKWSMKRWLDQALRTLAASQTSRVENSGLTPRTLCYALPDWKPAPATRLGRDLIAGSMRGIGTEMQVQVEAVTLRNGEPVAWGWGVQGTELAQRKPMLSE